ncbi:MAG: DNA repair protein RadC [Patescibacteria group bacterium]|jgi:DNA repair protein RadC
MIDPAIPMLEDPLIHCREDCRSWPVTRLLSAVLCSGNAAAALLSRFGSLDVIADAGTADLVAIPGIGRRRATQVLAAFELSRRAAVPRTEQNLIIRTAQDAVQVVGPVLGDLKREMFVTLLLTTRHRLLKFETVSVGSLNASIVHPREVFRPAIQAAAASMLLAHNHPSGDPEPSEDDVEMTHRLVRTGEMLGIEVIDHVIIGAGGSYLSFRERGLI